MLLPMVLRLHVQRHNNVVERTPLPLRQHRILMVALIREHLLSPPMAEPQVLIFGGAVGIPYYIQFLNGSATKVGSPITFTGDGQWHRYEVSITGQTTVYVTVRKNNSASTAAFYIDGFQIEDKIGYSTTYMDGDQDGCFWDALLHGSTSQRYSNYRGGGRKINLSTYDAYVLDMSGVGTPPIETAIIPYGNIPGGNYVGSTVGERTMTIGVTISAGNSIDPLQADDLSAWQMNMEAIFDLMKPNATYPQQPFVLGYQHGNNDIEIDCVYAGGFDLQNEKLKSITDLAFQVKCPYPYWRQTTKKYAAITQSTKRTGSAGTEDIYLRDPDGVMTLLTPTGTNSFTVRCMHIGAVDGKLYVGCAGATINNVTVNGIAVYDFMTGTWSALGSGVSGDSSGLALGTYVNAIVQIDNGDIIYGGSFTTANGVTTQAIARWNGSTATIIGKANPFAGNAQIVSLEIDPLTRDVLVGGVFLAGTTTGCLTNYLGRIVTTGASLAWTSGANFTAGNYINKIATYGIYTYVAGVFIIVGTTGGGNNQVNGYGFARFNNQTLLWEDIAIGSTVTTGYDIAIDTHGGVYMVGDYLQIGGQTIPFVAYYNGYAYSSPMSVAFYTAIGQIFYDIEIVNGEVYLMGIKTTYKIVGTNPVNELAYQDFNVSSYPIIKDKGNGYAIIAYSSGFISLIPAITSVTNSGSVDVNPVIKLTGGFTTGLLKPACYYIKNNTNGSAIYFDTYRLWDTDLTNNTTTMVYREVITIDCRPGRNGISSNIRKTDIPISPISQETSFFLSPGANSIEVLTSDSTLSAPLTIEVFWTEEHWTFFGGHAA
jgi:hypothetical protein